ncbi:hypothetical protein Plav_1589 [Parvibaculum lavamentivorans DS-1]|uniref:Uncharacterized protein n=1 Tax=Parvibaculum lavamentivorans (strain DS-1 / DSM 13023 / NCIMB 13966) TaxID=402881 RepID=A7HTH5_PARL1|nr:hypothetical protein [Parvibaculum lavamentivorans]ABS63208.1 hypothetical protein Plav_1589 [Parvibaculum lavamentivorans DS-1]
MNTVMLTPEEAGLKALGVACQSASRFYETAADVTHGHWQDFAKRRTGIYAAAALRIAELLQRDELLPGTPDEDMEWLKQLALRAQAALSGDEAGTLLKSFTRAERRIWDALGEFGAAGIAPGCAEIANSLANTAMEGFLWLGEEKEVFLKERGE